MSESVTRSVGAVASVAEEIAAELQDAVTRFKVDGEDRILENVRVPSYSAAHGHEWGH